MKRKFLIVLSAMLMLMCGCSTKKEEPLKSEYMLSYNVKDVSGVETSAVVYEYNEIGEKIAYKNISSLRRGMIKYFTADDKAVKVKIYLTLKNTSLSLEQNWWVGIVYYLTPGEITEIIVDDETRMHKTEP